MSSEEPNKHVLASRVVDEQVRDPDTRSRVVTVETHKPSQHGLATTATAAPRVNPKRSKQTRAGASVAWRQRAGCARTKTIQIARAANRWRGGDCGGDCGGDFFAGGCRHRI